MKGCLQRILPAGTSSTTAVVVSTIVRRCGAARITARPAGTNVMTRMATTQTTQTVRGCAWLGIMTPVNCLAHVYLGRVFVLMGVKKGPGKLPEAHTAHIKALATADTCLTPCSRAHHHHSHQYRHHTHQNKHSA